MKKLSTMCLNKNVVDCEVCKCNYPMLYHKCVRLADRKMRTLETHAKDKYCDTIGWDEIIDMLREDDQDLYHELRRFIEGEN